MLDWFWHAGELRHAAFTGGPCKGAIAAWVSLPDGRLRAHIPMRGDPFVDLEPVDTLAELEAQVVAWYEEHPPTPLPEPGRRREWRRVANRPE